MVPKEADGHAGTAPKKRGPVRTLVGAGLVMDANLEELVLLGSTVSHSDHHGFFLGSARAGDLALATALAALFALWISFTTSGS